MTLKINDLEHLQSLSELDQQHTCGGLITLDDLGWVGDVGAFFVEGIADPVYYNPEPINFIPENQGGDTNGGWTGYS